MNDDGVIVLRSTEHWEDKLSARSTSLACFFVDRLFASADGMWSCRHLFQMKRSS